MPKKGLSSLLTFGHIEKPASSLVSVLSIINKAQNSNTPRFLSPAAVLVHLLKRGYRRTMMNGPVEWQKARESAAMWCMRRERAGPVWATGDINYACRIDLTLCCLTYANLSFLDQHLSLC